jgi:hypothetical protein
MEGAVISLRESRIVRRLSLIAQAMTLISIVALAAYGIWLAAATALIVGVVGWRQKLKTGGVLLIGADTSVVFVGANSTDAAYSRAPLQTLFMSAFGAFGLLIVTLRGKPATVIVAGDSATPEDRRKLGLWLKKVPATTNYAASARS